MDGGLHRWPLLGVLTLPLMLGCGGGGGVDESEAVARRAVQTPAVSAQPAQPGPPPPIVLISIDTLRSDRLPAYGHDGVETPAIDRLARDGVVFERAYAHTPLTLPSHASIFTGQLPARHGVRDNRGYAFDPTGRPYLARELAQVGYRSAGAVSAYVLHRSSGLGGEAETGAVGFERWDDAIATRDDVALGGVARAGSETFEAIRPWLAEMAVAEAPFFLFLHLFEPHSPWAPPEPFASTVASPYDGEIAEADRVVALLLAELNRLGRYDECLIVLLSDHGEGLGDHGEEEHGLFLYREALQVPLILKPPVGVGGPQGPPHAGHTWQPGDRVAAPVQLVDVLPTLLEAAGVEVAVAELDGVSLYGPLDPGRPHLAETFYPRLHFGWSELRSVIEGPLHLVEGPDPELFDLLEDPAEQSDLLPRRAEQAEALRTHLLTDDGFEPPSPIDAETRRRLAALGYLSGGGVVGDAGSLPDPKAQLPTLEGLRRARDHLERGELDTAVSAYRRVLRDNPGLLDAWQALGDLLLRMGRRTDALAAYRRAFDLSGGDPQRRGTLVRLELEEALAALGRGDWSTAEGSAERVVELDPEQVEGWNDLGVARWQLGRHDAALDAWQHATTLDPEAWDTLFNLGTRAAELGREAVAREALGRFVAGAPSADYGRDLVRARVLLRRLER